jgi:hypothetical protein
MLPTAWLQSTDLSVSARASANAGRARPSALLRNRYALRIRLRQADQTASPMNVAQLLTCLTNVHFSRPPGPRGSGLTGPRGSGLKFEGSLNLRPDPKLLLGIPLAPLTQDSCVFYEQNVVVSDHGGAVVLEMKAGQKFAAGFGQNRAAIHQNHGHFTVGATVDEAVFWFVCFERCAQAQLLAMAAGTPKHIPHETAVYTRENAGSAQVGWMHFQPLWQEICRTDPELFE